MENTPKHRYFTVTGRAKAGSNGHTMRVPGIHIAGRWLEKAGFSIGTIVEMEVNHQCLTIRKSSKQWLLEDN